MMRVRIRFEKTEKMRFTSHLDLHRTWERTFRRARLPIAYTQGFSPHPKINIASALPLGFTGENEIVDVWLENPIEIDQIQFALQKSLPPGIIVRDTQEIDPHQPSLQSTLESLEYIITLLKNEDNLITRIEELVNTSQIIRNWRGKEYNLRPLIYYIEMIPLDTFGRQRILLRLAAKEGATGRPEEVVSALTINPLSVRIHRLRLLMQDT
jgi:radical SAM-linked protein